MQAVARQLFWPFLLSIILGLHSQSYAQTVSIINRPQDPHGTPRPARDAVNVPVRTSFYVEIGLQKPAAGDQLDPKTVTLRLQDEQGKELVLIAENEHFQNGSTGWMKPRAQGGGAGYNDAASLAVYVDPNTSLQPATEYTAFVTAKSLSGAEMPNGLPQRWKFRTAEATPASKLAFDIDFHQPAVRWEGQFFSGLCQVLFCTPEAHLDTLRLMDEARKEHPKAWSFQRDFWMTGLSKKAGTFEPTLPNIVREKETRRIVAIEPHEQGHLLRTEDFLGHEQYGIPSGRPVSEDYQAGHTVLIVDSSEGHQATVVSADDSTQTVIVSGLKTPERGWHFDYDQVLSEEEDPHMPGIFPSGGVHLVKLNPHGTACYYWGRLDKEWDLVHKGSGQRLLPNFADAPGDLARDGHNWTVPKDYAQYHETVRTISGHIIDRYGDASLDFTWSVFNEPDLGRVFWRASWEELLTFYDYTVDGILRAFEDRGYDSSRVQIGGLELGAIFGTNMKLKEFLTHCSPTASQNEKTQVNAAVADVRLNGKRSRRVEELCAAHAGHGSPCDFISIHAYNGSKMMSAKMIRAKEMALEIDPEFYQDLWVNSHESCPEWSLPPDQAAGESYLGNGFAETWCVDLSARLLEKAAADPRYGYGETLFTVWPTIQMFSGINTISRILNIDEDGDGQADRQETIATPLFHTLTLLSDFGKDFWVLPTVTEGGHRIGGFASKDGTGTIRVLLYTHDEFDPQSRSDKAFQIALNLQKTGLPETVQIQEYRLDKSNNSYYSESLDFQKKLAPQNPETTEQINERKKQLESSDPQVQLTALKALADLRGESLYPYFAAIMQIQQNTTDGDARSAIADLIQLALSGRTASPDELKTVIEKSQFQATNEAEVTVSAEGNLTYSPEVSANGMNLLVIRPK